MQLDVGPHRRNLAHPNKISQLHHSSSLVETDSDWFRGLQDCLESYNQLFLVSADPVLAYDLEVNE